MRTFPMTAVLSIAIVLGGALADSAMSANNPGSGNPSGSNQMSANPRGGGGGGGRDIDRNDPGAGNSEAMGRFYECPNGGAAGIDCPFPKPLKLTPKEEDCQCKPVAMKVGGKTQIVLDCYKTKEYNNVKRTYICTRPE